MSVIPTASHDDSGSEDGRSAWSSWSGGSVRVRGMKSQSCPPSPDSQISLERSNWRYSNPDRSFEYEFDMTFSNQQRKSDDQLYLELQSHYVFRNGLLHQIDDNTGQPEAAEEHSKRSNDEAPDPSKGQSTLAPSGEEMERESRSAAARSHPSESLSHIDASILGLPSELASRTEASSCHSSASPSSSPETTNILPQSIAQSETTRLSKSTIPSRNIAYDGGIAEDEGDWLSRMSLYLAPSEDSAPSKSTVNE